MSKKIVSALLLVSLLISSGAGWYLFQQKKVIVKGATVITSGDFNLNATSSWSQEDQKNVLTLEWDEIGNLSQGGYRIYQSGDKGGSWEIRSSNYGKRVRVLNIYPDEKRSNTFKTWMESLNLYDDNHHQLIEVTPVSNREYNANPLKYLKNSAGEWQYDVIMSGSWDANNNVTMQELPAKYIQDFIDSGRGVLFGHDTVTGNLRGNAHYRRFADVLGVTWTTPENQRQWTGSTKIKLINNGYLMKYPFEMKDNVVLTIPYAHNIELQHKNTGTVWLEFIDPSGAWRNPAFDDGTNRGAWYLKTNGNVGMIQTGHSNGQSTMDERKIIANVLYNLAQVSMETEAQDQSVKDDQPPKKPVIKTQHGLVKELVIEVNSQDEGKVYQLYVEANTKDRGVLRSDTVEEVVTSKLAGYIYQVTDQKNFNLKEVVEREYKDEFGRIPKERYNVYVAPGDGAQDYENYETKGLIKIDQAGKQADRFLHVVAVDRGNNVSEVTTNQINDLLTEHTVTEIYLDDQGSPVKEQTVQVVEKGQKYQKEFPEILNYGMNAYQVDGEPLVTVTTNRQTVVIPTVLRNRQVVYYYHQPVNVYLRLIVLNRKPEIALPKKGQVNLGQERNEAGEDPLNKLTYQVNIGDQLDQVDFTKIIIPRQKEFPYFHLKAVEPSLYRYAGMVVTPNQTLHDPIGRVMGELNQEILPGSELWVSFYLEPNLTQQVSLAVVNDRLIVYYANIEEFKVRIDGEEYQTINVPRSFVQESKTLEIPVSQFRHKVAVEYQDENNVKQTVYWNNSLWDFVE